ncbi:MAG: ROK family protein [Desulfohalobiaceae bacterium]|nr:ROK family protein [Desulfohalobiaceae bacterium]
MYACLDMGGTNLRGTWIDTSGNRGEILSRSRPRSLEGTKNALLELIADIRESAPEEVHRVGLGSAGPLDYRSGCYLRPTNMPELEYFPVAEFVQEQTGLPLLLENDAQAAALGEVWSGSLAGSQDGLVLTLGTGVGSGVIFGGRIWRAAHFTGPELGHIHLGFGRPECGCGQVGCAETWLNKQALLDLFRDYGCRVASLRQGIDRLREEEPQARGVMGEYGQRLGLFISILQVVFGLQHIGISGGLSHFLPYCREAVWQTLRERFHKRQWWLPERIQASPDPEMSGLLGAARACILHERDNWA